MRRRPPATASTPAAISAIAIWPSPAASAPVEASTGDGVRGPEIDWTGAPDDAGALVTAGALDDAGALVDGELGDVVVGVGVVVGAGVVVGGVVSSGAVLAILRSTTPVVVCSPMVICTEPLDSTPLTTNVGVPQATPLTEGGDGSLRVTTVPTGILG